MKPDIRLRQASSSDLDTVLSLVAAYHAFERIKMPEEKRRRAVARLLDDPALGAIWCIERAGELIGYIAVCLGYSIEFAGRDAFIDEFYVISAERGQGVGGEVIRQVCALLTESGIAALHLEVDNGNTAAQRFYEDHGFVPRRKYHLMSLELTPRDRD